MRLKNLIIGDIRFQVKYGFYFVYVILTIFYIALLFALPTHWRKKAAAIMIFSDPAAMGLFFMGAIVLLEKSQRVIDALTVSPVKIIEYILSKVISLSFLSVMVAMVLALAAGGQNLLLILIGTILSSVIFTLVGLIVATKIGSLNQFFMVIIPIEILCFVPAFLYLFGYKSNVLRWYPINLCLGLIANKNENNMIAIILILTIIALLSIIAYRCVSKMWKSVGGVRL